MAQSNLITVDNYRARLHRTVKELVDAFDTSSGHAHDGSDSASLSAAGGTLDEAYDEGGPGAGRAITVNAGAITMTKDDAGTENILEINQTPSGSAAGAGIKITNNAASTGAGIEFANSGGGNDIEGTSSSWSISAAGVALFASIDVNGAADAIILDADGDTTISAPTANQIDFEVGGSDVMVLTGTTLVIDSAVATTLGGALTVTGNAVFNGSVTFNAATSIDLNGGILILDADADTTISSDTNNQIDFQIGGADDFQMTANTFSVLSGSALNIDTGATMALTGTTTVVNDSLFTFGSGSVVNFSFDTTDGNANALLIQLPIDDGTDVPAIIIGQSIESVDFGQYAALKDPAIGLIGVGAVATAPRIDFWKSRGTAGTPTVITTGDMVGEIRGYAWGGASGYYQNAAIEFDTEGTIADTKVAGVIRFRTGTEASPTILTTALTIDSAQLATFSTGITVNGAVTTLSLAGQALNARNTTDGASVQVAVFEGFRATEAGGDAAYIDLNLKDDGNNPDIVARIGWEATAVAAGAGFVGDLVLYSSVAGAITEFIRLDGSASQIVVGNADLVMADGNGIIVGATAMETVSIGDGSTDMVPEVQIQGTTQDDGSLALMVFNTTNTIAPTLAFVKSGNAAIGSHTTVDDDEYIGRIIAYADDGADLETPVAEIRFVVDGTPAANQIGGAIEIYTTVDGGSTLTKALTIDTAQNTLLTGGKILQSLDATEIGISVTNAALTVGSLGSMVAPYQSTTDNAFNDGVGGNIDGAFGFQRDSDGGPLLTLEARMNGAWVSVALAGTLLPAKREYDPKLAGDYRVHPDQVFKAGGRTWVDESKCYVCGEAVEVDDAVTMYANYKRTNGDIHAIYGHTHSERDTYIQALETRIKDLEKAVA